MSEAAGVTHDTAARLLGLAPIELDRLVREGLIRRNDRNSYSVPVLVAGYVAYLKAMIAGTAGHPKQAEVAAHLDLSDRSVRELEPKLSLPTGYTLAEFRIAYIRHLREVAAGRMGEGTEGLELATERARLAKEQADKIAMQNAERRGELAPVAAMEMVIAAVGAKVGRILDTIPGTVRRRVPGIGADVIEAITADIAKCRNMAAAMTLADLDEDEDPDTEPADLQLD